MAKSWKIRHLFDEATIEIMFLFQSADVQAEIKRILRLLVQQPDPRRPPLSSELIVDELDQDAPGWFRVKVLRYGIRIVFRLVIVRQGRMVELGRLEPVPNDADEYYIDIVQAGYRKDVYGEELRKRYVRRQSDN
jgi:hypothetical protein